jgi:hypothetical protein
MLVELNQQQRDLLLDLVNEALEEIGPEIHHTWTRSYKTELKDRRRELTQVRGMLGEQAGSPAGRDASELIGTP